MVLRGKLRGRVGSRRDYLTSPREHFVLAGFCYLPFWVKIARIRYEDGDLDQTRRLLGISILPRQGLSVADRAGPRCLSGKLIHRLHRFR